jgi:hypothetical protein
MSPKLIRTVWCVLVASASMFGQISLFARLSGAAVVPPTPSAGTGIGRFTVNEDGSVTYWVTASGLSGSPVSAQLRQAAAGGNGAVVITLAAGTTTATEWRGTSAVLTAAQRTALLTDGCYVLINTSAFATGEIRGQILGVRRWRFKATLDGAQETPPTGSAATATGEAWFIEPENVLVYDIDVAGLAPLTAAHLHNGAVGVMGPPIFSLSGTNLHLCGVSPTLAAADVTALKAGNTYFNLHTAAFPAGEIRGQLLRASEEFTFFANGAQEVPPVPTAHTACGVMVLNPTSNVLTYSIATTVPVIAAMHLHTGAPGQSGPVSITITGAPPNITGTTAPLTAAQMDTLRRGNFYFNLHTMAFPGGEIRGQVRPAADVFGFGAPDTAGGPPRIGADGYVGTGATFDVTLADATPSQLCLLFIGTQETFWPLLATTLPFEAGILGAPGSYVWTDWDLGLFFNVPTDAEGCARLSVAVPALPVFDCFRFMGQFLIPAPGANAFGFVTSDALVIRIAHTQLTF